ncbi:hypothetical protein [Pelagicoccus sp. SDUM812003]|uniref:hypothetical protein n=1 Tax=Pelagicoccus sp. SDUM812003 TaxID=3041267 RepID=UPI00280E9E1B|nr:hypothetical protein [Pelagicoccus sp. SDUM812003]MDQ8202805.1 hypothetical protein [Pelagicoccus sp. SDUM812003]
MRPLPLLFLALACIMASTARTESFIEELDGPEPGYHYQGPLKPTFVLPAGFTPIPPDDPKAIKPDGERTWVSSVSPSENTIYSIDLVHYPDKSLSLSALLANARPHLESTIPGVEFEFYGLVEVNGDKWVFAEFYPRNEDDRRYNYLMTTVKERSLVSVNVITTKDEMPMYDAAIREALRSIYLKPDRSLLDEPEAEKREHPII